ncbi:SpoIIE family protein phosphatase [Novipirellula artificiosorum]|uniref:Phosphoserine phosphatase RsbP n=1 Tax=Novipirellula artificiosorum TaxID=2528016 RepID=A0A5C6D1W2_9BACT|nr:SpoIIE family protein phosphatase [Novipirellula artificiosorum]TWU30820.1 Phosphoserine phosphatase RsbP [Novipirellula artificiosorum]
MMAEDKANTIDIEKQFQQKIVVLLVDDQAMVGEAVRRMLAPHEDITLHYCQDPRHALQRAIEIRPTLILQDLVMPEISGLDLVPQYRQNEATQDTPLIVLSTKEEAETKAKAFALGANDYLVKLPDPVELLARIRYHSRGYISLLQRNAAYEALAQSRRHMAEQLEAGCKYLLALLPEPIESPVAVSWCYVPSADLGGDTFGYYWIDEDHFALYLIDVVGHGLDSALLSVTLMNVLRSRALANTDFCEPGQVLKALNDAFPMEEYGEKCFTMWYGVYQPSTSTLAWSGGGHPEALLFEGSPEKTAEPLRLESQGPMIGMMPWDEFESGRCHVGSGSSLFVFSDGVHEIHKTDGKEWEFEDFVQYLAAIRQSADPTMDQLLRHVRELGGSDQLDDDFSIFEVKF